MISPELMQERYDDVGALVRRVGRIFGYSGLSIEVKPGEGWYTESSPRGIKLAVDPLMLRPKDLKDAVGNEIKHPLTIPEEHYTVYGTCHELGHVEDFLDPLMAYDQQRGISGSDQFFWNVLDDAVINRRLTNIPLLNTITNQIYEEVLFPDDEYDTVGGLVTAAIGHLPETGEELTLGRFLFRVARADARRVHAFHVGVLADA